MLRAPARLHLVVCVLVFGLGVDMAASQDAMDNSSFPNEAAGLADYAAVAVSGGRRLMSVAGRLADSSGS